MSSVENLPLLTSECSVIRNGFRFISEHYNISEQDIEEAVTIYKQLPLKARIVVLGSVVNSLAKLAGKENDKDILQTQWCVEKMKRGIG